MVVEVLVDEGSREGESYVFQNTQHAGEGEEEADGEDSAVVPSCMGSMGRVETAQKEEASSDVKEKYLKFCWFFCIVVNERHGGWLSI